jgi:hypothetical protein
MPKLTDTAHRGLIKNPGRHGDGGGLFFGVTGPGKAQWSYRYRVHGKEREMSLRPGPRLMASGGVGQRLGRAGRWWLPRALAKASGRAGDEGRTGWIARGRLWPLLRPRWGMSSNLNSSTS